MQLIIFKIPSNMTGYDWTYRFGTATYDTQDCNTVHQLQDEIENLNIQTIKKIHTKITKTNEYYTANNTKNKPVMIDIEAVSSDNEDQIEDEIEDALKDDDIKQNYESSWNLKRLKATRIEIAWLLTVTEREFIMTITPTPG